MKLSGRALPTNSPHTSYHSESAPLSFIFYLLPRVPEMGVPQKSAMSHILAQRANITAHAADGNLRLVNLLAAGRLDQRE